MYNGRGGGFEGALVTNKGRHFKKLARISVSVRYGLAWLACPVLAIGLSLVWSNGPATAQTLSEEIGLLLQNNPRIEERRAALRRAQQDVNSAFSAFYPQVSATGSAGGELVSNPTTRLTNDDNEIVRFNALGFEIRQNIYNGGATFNRVDSARLTRDSSALVLDSTVHEVMLQGITAYLDVLRLNELIRVSRARERTIKQQLDLETERVERGAGIEVDVLQAKSRLQLAIEQRVDLEGQLRQAVAVYIQVFEREPDITRMRLEPSPLDLVPPSVEDALYTSREENPQVRGLEYVVRSLRAGIEASRAGYMPTIDVVGRWDHESNVGGTRDVTKEMAVLLELNWDLFSGFATDADVRRSQELYLEAIAVTEQARLEIERRVRASWTKLQNTRERKELLLNAVSIAQEVFSARQKLRAAGKETSLNVLDAESEVFQAEQNLIRADYDARIAVFELAQAMGILSPATIGVQRPVIEDREMFRTDLTTLEFLPPDEDALSRRERDSYEVRDINPPAGGESENLWRDDRVTAPPQEDAPNAADAETVSPPPPAPPQPPAAQQAPPVETETEEPSTPAGETEGVIEPPPEAKADPAAGANETAASPKDATLADAPRSALVVRADTETARDMPAAVDPLAALPSVPTETAAAHDAAEPPVEPASAPIAAQTPAPPQAAPPQAAPQTEDAKEAANFMADVRSWLGLPEAAAPEPPKPVSLDPAPVSFEAGTAKSAGVDAEAQAERKRQATVDTAPKASAPSLSPILKGDTNVVSVPAPETAPAAAPAPVKAIPLPAQPVSSAAPSALAEAPAKMTAPPKSTPVLDPTPLPVDPVQTAKAVSTAQSVQAVRSTVQEPADQTGESISVWSTETDSGFDVPGSLLFGGGTVPPPR